MRPLSYLLPFAILGCNILTFGCANQNKGFGGTVENLTSNIANFGTSLEYRSPEILAAEVDKEAKMKKWDNTQILKKKAQLPPGGVLWLRIERSTIGAANMKYFTIIVEESGKEILRKQGRDSIPQTPLYSHSGWWNLESFYLTQLPQAPLRVYVVDDIQEKRFEFLVTPDFVRNAAKK